jgi:transposase-like protein
VGDLWTWTAIDADEADRDVALSKRYREDAGAFIRDLSERVDSERVQIATDGLRGAARRSSGGSVFAPTMAPT